jgi:hypothetical protein
MKQADRWGARYALILESERAQLRDLESGEQRAIDPAKVIQELADD